MSNIDEDIKYVKECLKLVRVFFKAIKKETDYKEIDDVAFCIAIDNILSELEQNKKRIKRLEYENETLKDFTSAIFNENIEKEFIRVQKVKDVLQNNRNELFSTTYINDEQYKPCTMQIKRINKIENELLEDK